MSKLINLEAEQSVLGAILLDRRCIDKIDDLRSEDFSNEAHKIIFDCILKLDKKNSPIDLITLTNELKAIGYLEDIGGISYVTSLSTIVPTTSNIMYYGKILKDLSYKRKIIKSAYNLIESLDQGKDTDTVLGVFEKAIQLQESNNSDDIFMINIMANILEKLESGAEERIKTNIRAIDKRTNGIGKKELIAIGAGSGVGKTSIGLKIALEAYIQGKRILIISREMSKEQVAERILLHQVGMNKFKYDSRDFDDSDWKRLIQAMQMYSTKNIAIDDKVSTIQGIKRRIREFKPDLVMVDYVQLLTSTSDANTREREVAEFSRELKNITLDFEIPVIQLTQLADKGNDYRPHGETYTRESRAIYHDSNVVIYLHRVTNEKELSNAYEKLVTFKERGSFEVMKKTIDAQLEKDIRFIEVIVDKNRTGSTGSNYYWFKGSDLNYYPIA